MIKGENDNTVSIKIIALFRFESRYYDPSFKNF